MDRNWPGRAAKRKRQKKKIKVAAGHTTGGGGGGATHWGGARAQGGRPSLEAGLQGRAGKSPANAQKSFSPAAMLPCPKVTPECEGNVQNAQEPKDMFPCDLWSRAAVKHLKTEAGYKIR